jgi:hypothetical protein
MATMHLAMFNYSIDPKYQSYKFQNKASSDTSLETAAASAAANLLLQMFPTRMFERRRRAILRPGRFESMAS